MSALSIQVPFPVFQDRDGQPLDNGYVWIGEPNLNPQTNPVVAYYDEALTIIAAQPLRTINGYVSRSGSPSKIYIDGVNFSILVQDSKGSMVYSFAEGTGISVDASGIAYYPPFTGSVPSNVEAKLAQTISVQDFGAVGDGVTNDYAALQAAANYAQSSGKRLYFIGGETYKVLGSTNLTFKCSVEFNNASLDISDFSAQVVLSTVGDWTEDATALTAIQASGASSSFVGGWANLPTISEHFVRITTNQYLYQYLGNPVYRVEDNLVTRFGQLASHLKWAISGATVTKVEKLPFNKHVTEYKNVVFILDDREFTNAVIVRDASNIKLENIGFQVDENFIAQTSNPTYLVIFDSGKVEVDGLFFIAPSVSANGGGFNNFTYGLNLDRGYDFTIKNAIGQGDGWGVVGSNFTQKVTFENCNLSRIDYHNPFREYLKVKDCTIGNWGITICAIGDLILDNVIFKQSGVTYVDNRGFIRSREDTGGFCDGNLFAKNITLYNGLANRAFLDDNGSSSEAPITTTPVDYVFWKNVFVENLVIDGLVVNLAPILGAALFMKNPLSVNYNNVSGASRFEISANAAPYQPHNGTAGQEIYTGFPNYNVNLSNCVGLVETYFVNDNAALLYSVSINNCQNTSTRGVYFKSVDNVIAGFKNSTIEALNFFYVSATTKRQKINVDNCVVNHTAEFTTNPIESCNNLVSLTLADSFVTSGAVGNFTNNNGFTAAKLISVKISYGSTYGVNNLQLSTDASFTLPTSFNFNNSLYVGTGFDGSNTFVLTSTSIRNPRASTTHTFFRDSAGNITITTGASTLDLTVASSSEAYRETTLIFG